MRPSKWLPLKGIRAPVHQAKMLSHIRSLGLTGHDQAVLSHKDKRLLMDKMSPKQKGRKILIPPATQPLFPGFPILYPLSILLGMSVDGRRIQECSTSRLASESESDFPKLNNNNTGLLISSPQLSTQTHPSNTPTGCCLWGRVLLYGPGLNLPLPDSTSQVLGLQSCPAMPYLTWLLYFQSRFTWPSTSCILHREQSCNFPQSKY